MKKDNKQTSKPRPQAPARCLIIIDSFFRLSTQKKSLVKRTIMRCKRSGIKVLLCAQQNDAENLSFNRRQILKKGIATWQNEKTPEWKNFGPLKKLRFWGKVMAHVPDEIAYLGKDKKHALPFLKKYFPFTKILKPNIPLSLEAARNLDPLTVARFGEEWARFSQPANYDQEQQSIWSLYFSKFPRHVFNSRSVGCDFGCGSGRWSRIVARKVGKLWCLDPSLQALAVAKKNLQDLSNCHFHQASISVNDIPKNSLDFGYCLGVLHHMPDPLAGLRSCVEKLKPGAPFLLYFYQSIALKPILWFYIHCVVSWMRANISRFSLPFLNLACDTIAACVYWPLARFAKVVDFLGADFKKIPLYFYRDLSFYTMRTDARDRFGTPLENRKSKEDLKQLMESAGLEKIVFNPNPPFWTAYGFRSLQSR